ncbi:hypothetical protein ON010_g683 [Phytophthora cinnamomi]|nr:hypothetical protein ON010_g683 [Phytophthora cinnamomi]
MVRDWQLRWSGGWEKLTELVLCCAVLQVESLEKERDFYFNKLREVEIMLQGTEDSEANPLAQEIFKVLYATEEEGAEEEQMAGEPQDEQM